MALVISARVRCAALRRVCGTRHCRQSQKAQHVRILIEDTKKQVAAFSLCTSLSISDCNVEIAARIFGVST